MYYAGIGSRDTPKNVLTIMSQLARWLSSKGYTLRSGAAKGADKAFEDGCDSANGNKEIYLPWKGFNGSKSELYQIREVALSVGRQFHPNFDGLSQGAQKLQARNTYQIMGLDMYKLSDFVICWTTGGSGKGGTGQAIRIANYLDVPVLDLGVYGTDVEIKNAINEFIRENMKCVK